MRHCPALLDVDVVGVAVVVAVVVAIFAAVVAVVVAAVAVAVAVVAVVAAAVAVVVADDVVGDFDLVVDAQVAGVAGVIEIVAAGVVAAVVRDVVVVALAHAGAELLVHNNPLLALYQMLTRNSNSPGSEHHFSPPHTMNYYCPVVVQCCMFLFLLHDTNCYLLRCCPNDPSLDCHY